jgi:HEAT repeats
MAIRGRSNSLLSSVLLMFSVTTLAQGPNWVNAKVQTHSAATGLDRQFRALTNSQTEAAWIGYSVPAVEGNHRICCHVSRDRHLPHAFKHDRCMLESDLEGMNVQSNDEGGEQARSDLVLVLFRVAQKSVGNIRIFSEECQLDAGGLPVYWLTDFQAKESIDLLASLASGTKEEHTVREPAIAAIAFHAETAADRMLEQFVEPKQAESVRKNAAFWLGNLRGRKGYEILRRLMREDSSQTFREQCVFALSISRVPEAVDALVDAAHNDQSSQVRGQALFWLSQKAGKKAAEAITDAIRNDPETEVKKKAVFALSQLPKGEGIPKLIQVARSHRNPEVRKDAMFWLGQSNDPRALAFFEEILAR